VTNALRRGAYILAVYKDSKFCTAKYLSFLENENCGLQGIEKAAELFEQIVEDYNKMTDIIPFPIQEEQLEKSRIPELLTLLRKCLKTEEEAMNILASLL
jgi:hypothetical protein